MDRHLVRVDWAPNRNRPPDLDAWPFNIPAVRQLIRDGGLEIPAGVTVLVGENGSGKSTLIEALAEIYPRRGFENPFAAVTGARGSGEDSPLNYHLRVRTNPMASPAGFFLRAESMHGFLDAVDSQDTPFGFGEGRLNRRSHGESFLAVLRHRFEDVGVYFMDEPEAALSFRSCLALLALLDIMRREGSQVIVSTHSPIIMALPGATLLELGEHGIRPVERYDDLELVGHWRSFLDAPQRYLRHLLVDEDRTGA